MRLEVLIFAAIAGCSGSNGPDEDLGGLVKRRNVTVEPIDVAKATTNPAELRRALMQPHSRIAGELGAHVFSGTSRVRVTAGDEVVRDLSDETSIRYAAGGEFEARLDNSHDYGRHAVFAGGALYLQPRFGKYHRRAPTSDAEPAKIRDDIYGTFGDYFDLVSAAAEPKDAGAATVGGRSGHKVELVMADSARDRDETLPRKEWRNDAEVLSVSGYAVLDDATGAVLDGRLEGSVAFARDGKTYTMTVTATHKIDASAAVSVAAPPDEQTVATRLRPHELEEREQLLEGIAPPLRKTPVPP